MRVFYSTIYFLKVSVGILVGRYVDRHVYNFVYNVFNGFGFTRGLGGRHF